MCLPPSSLAVATKTGAGAPSIPRRIGSALLGLAGLVTFGYYADRYSLPGFESERVAQPYQTLFYLGVAGALTLLALVVLTGRNRLLGLATVASVFVAGLGLAMGIGERTGEAVSGGGLVGAIVVAAIFAFALLWPRSDGGDEGKTEPVDGADEDDLEDEGDPERDDDPEGDDDADDGANGDDADSDDDDQGDDADGDDDDEGDGDDDRGDDDGDDDTDD